MSRTLARSLVETLELGGGLAAVVAIGVLVAGSRPDAGPTPLFRRLVAEHAAICHVCRRPAGPEDDGARTAKNGEISAQGRQDSDVYHEVEDVNAMTPADAGARGPEAAPPAPRAGRGRAASRPMP